MTTKIGETDCKRCYECGMLIIGRNGCYIGDTNPDVPTRAICSKCILELVKVKFGIDLRGRGEIHD